jgi:hypothetical protein
MSHLCLYSGVQHILCCVFYFVCLHPVSCVPNVASFSGFSILDCPFGFSNFYVSIIVVIQTSHVSTYYFQIELQQKNLSTLAS